MLNRNGVLIRRHILLRESRKGRLETPGISRAAAQTGATPQRRDGVAGAQNGEQGPHVYSGAAIVCAVWPFARSRVKSAGENGPSVRFGTKKPTGADGKCALRRLDP